MAEILKKILERIHVWQTSSGFWSILAATTVTCLLLLFIYDELLIFLLLAAVGGIVVLWFFPEAGLAFTVNGVVALAVARDLLGLSSGQWVTVLIMGVFVVSLAVILLKDVQIIEWRRVFRLMVVPALFGVLVLIAWLGSEQPAYANIKLIRYFTLHMTVSLAAAFSLISKQRLQMTLTWLAVLGIVSLLGSLLSFEMLSLHLGRLSVTRDVNPIAFARSLGFGSIAALLYWGYSRKGNAAVILMVIMTIVVIVLTGSRGPFLGFFFALVFFFLAWNRKPSRIVWSLLGLLVVLFLIILVMPSDFWAMRITSLAANATIMQRFTLWSRAIDLIAQNPIFGIGLGSYDAYIGYNIHWPHNIFLEIWLEVGLIAVLLFGWFIVDAIVTGWRQRKKTTDMQLRRIASVALSLLVMSLVVAQFSGDMTFNYLIWFAAVTLKGIPFLERTKNV